MTRTEYEQFATEIQAGGFYTNGLRPVGCELFSTVVCSVKLGRVLSGNSFWVTRFGGNWYLGTWGVQHYRVPDDRNVVDVCVAWLRRKSDETSSDFDDALKVEFELIPLSIQEFEAVWTAAGLCSDDDTDEA